MKTKTLIFGGLALVGGAIALSLVSSTPQNEQGYLMGGGSYSGTPLKTTTYEDVPYIQPIVNNYSFPDPDFSSFAMSDPVTKDVSSSNNTVRKKSGTVYPSTSSGVRFLPASEIKSGSNVYDSKTDTFTFFKDTPEPVARDIAVGIIKKSEESPARSTLLKSVSPSSLKPISTAQPNAISKKADSSKKAYNPFKTIKNNLSQPMSGGR